MKELLIELQAAYSLYEKSGSPLDWNYFRHVLNKIEASAAAEELLGEKGV